MREMGTANGQKCSSNTCEGCSLWSLLSTQPWAGALLSFYQKGDQTLLRFLGSSSQRPSTVPSSALVLVLWARGSAGQSSTKLHVVLLPRARPAPAPQVSRAGEQLALVCVHAAMRDSDAKLSSQPEALPSKQCGQFSHEEGKVN